MHEDDHRDDEKNVNKCKYFFNAINIFTQIKIPKLARLIAIKTTTTGSKYPFSPFACMYLSPLDVHETCTLSIESFVQYGSSLIACIKMHVVSWSLLQIKVKIFY